MSKDEIKTIAAVSPRITLGDVFKNASTLAEAAHACLPADLIVMPELCLTGATAGDLFLDSFFIEKTEDALQMLLEKTREVEAYLVFGAPYRIDGNLVNAAIVAKEGRLVSIVSKQALSLEERRYFSAHHTPQDSLPFLVTFAADKPAPAPLIVMLDASPFLLGSSNATQAYLAKKSKEDQACIVYANAGCGESVQSAVYAANNCIFEHGHLLSENTLWSKNAIKAERGESSHILMHATAQSPKDSAFPFIPSDISRTSQTILDIQAHGLVSRMKEIHTKHLVIGVSGGLDSTLALLASHRAVELLDVPPVHIHAISMPSNATSKRTHSNAEKIAMELSCTFSEIPITSAINEHLISIGHDLDTFDVTYENAQARERTQILFDVANQENALVVGTGDMSEVALGFATYNGDLSAHYGVNANVPKTLMRAIVREIANTTQNQQLQVVLLDIANTPISPELVPGQKTEEILGPYEVHDFYLYHFLKTHPAPKDLLVHAQNVFAPHYTKDELKAWLITFYKRFFASQFKRNVLCDGPQIQKLTITGKDGYALPTVASPNAWISQLKD